jgi:hypothetical protein
MEKLLLSMQHTLNPLHIYCRLVERGLDPQVSIRLSRCYEAAIYRRVGQVMAFFLPRGGQGRGPRRAL